MMAFIIILSIIYFKNTKEYFVHLVLMLDPALGGSRLTAFLVWLALYVFLVVVIILVFVPERLKYPSIIGCLIISVCFLTFWGNNFFTPLDNLSLVKPVVWDNLFPLISTSAFCFEGLFGYFAVRSSMKSKSQFSSMLRTSFVILFVVFVVNCVSFYLVVITRNSPQPFHWPSSTTGIKTSSSISWKSYFTSNC